MKLLKTVSQGLQHLLFPSICLHCKEEIEEGKAWLCPTCFSLLQLLPLQNKCAVCWGLLDQRDSRYCLSCRGKVLTACAAVFAKEGPAALFLHYLFQEHSLSFIKDAAAFMVLQMSALDWPLSDLIIPLPEKKALGKKKGKTNLLLAKELSSLLHSPMEDLLCHKKGLSWRKTRYWPYGEEETLRDISDQVLLLVEVEATRESLDYAARFLCTGCPKEIYALTICML